MTDPANFSEARERLDEIVKQVRSKDVSLEKSLDLFDEAIKMGNSCFEMIDRIDAGDMENVSSDDAPEAGEETLSERENTAERSKTDTETTIDQQSDEPVLETYENKEDREQEETSPAGKE